MCRCMKAFRFIGELQRLDEMRRIMAGPNLPKWKSVFDMNHEELKQFKEEVKKYELNR